MNVDALLDKFEQWLRNHPVPWSDKLTYDQQITDIVPDLIEEFGEEMKYKESTIEWMIDWIPMRNAIFVWLEREGITNSEPSEAGS